VAEATGALAPGAGLAARRSLVVAVLAVVAASRFAGAPAIWPVAALVALTVLFGALHALAVTDSATRTAGVPIEGLFLPAVVGYASVGVLQLVPMGIGLVLALGALAFMLDRVLGLEARLLGADRTPSDIDRTQVLVWAIVAAFLGFMGTAALVPGGLPEPGATAPDTGLDEVGLLALAVVDALVAGLVGYRIVALRVPELGLAIASALTYAGVIAIAAATLRAADIPRLVGPALLTLVVFLWDAFHSPPTGRRRDPRWLAQVALLVVLGGVVTVWNLALR
jgi:hypothetical protein